MTGTSTPTPTSLQETPEKLKTNDHHNHHDHDDNEEHDEHEEHDHEGHDGDEEEHEYDSDEEHDDKMKKRAILKKKRSNLEIVKEDQLIPGDITDFKKKKSIQWSKYFGMDRRKKSVGWPRKIHYLNQVKRDQNIEYPLHSFKNHDDNDEQYNVNNKGLNEDNLQHMNDKLKTIENLIIDETLKYTGAHEGISDPQEIRQLKDHVVSRLATAYSLEKMRRALEKLKNSVDQEQHLQKNEIEPLKEATDKRIAIKKENPEFDNSKYVHTVQRKTII